MRATDPKDQETPVPKSMLEHLVANLLDHFRRLENRQDWHKAAKIALNLVARTASKNPERLEKRFLFLANRLKDDLSSASIRAFAHSCLAAAYSSGYFSAGRLASRSPEASRSLQRRVQSRIATALAQGATPSEAIHRASLELASAHKKQALAQKMTRALEAHPLKEALAGLHNPQKRVAPEDIRNQLLRLKHRGSAHSPQDGKLLGLLEKTASFAPQNLHRLLGDELYLFCRPLGFTDKTCTLLVVEVPSSAHLYALTYRKPEILNALRADPTFSRAKNIRFKVRSSY